MELFSEVNNRYFLLVEKLLNECAEGKAKQDVLKIIDDGEFEQKVVGKNFQSFPGLMLNEYGDEDNYNLLKEKNGFYYPAVNGREGVPVPIRFSKIEKAWLKALLEEPCVTLLMSAETVTKLRGQLTEIDTPIRKEYIEMTNTLKVPDMSDCEGFEQNFRTILKAILEEKPVRYNNTDKHGNTYRDMLSLPVSIEFSMRDGRFRVSMYSLDSNRPIMANIFSMTDIRIEYNVKNAIDRETAKKLLHEQKYSPEPVVIEVTDKKAAMERCFMSFSGMERSAKCLGDHKYEIKLYYYMFEEDNLIRSILSLGPYVKVISPERIVNEVVARVRKAIGIMDGAGS